MKGSGPSGVHQQDQECSSAFVCLHVTVFKIQNTLCTTAALSVALLVLNTLAYDECSPCAVQSVLVAFSGLAYRLR